MTDARKEFDLIRRLFAPLAASRPEALGLLDDAAILLPSADTELVVTTDCLIAGVHFRAEDPPESIAARALRTNLSDLAAMGAAPDCYTMALGIPKECDETWLTAFTQQLGEDQETYEIDLIGGDTVFTPGPLTITVTAFGRVPVARAIRRSTAHARDDVYVSGHIGDATLGLALLKEGLTGISGRDADYLVNRFWYPSPRTTLGPALRGVASAMADVSDGLLADLGHICSASGVGATITADDVPVSSAAKGVITIAQTTIGALLTGGDDYELVFTAAPSFASHIQNIARDTNTTVRKIGLIQATDTPSVVLVDQAGTAIAMDHPTGYEHQW